MQALKEIKRIISVMDERTKTQNIHKRDAHGEFAHVKGYEGGHQSKSARPSAGTKKPAEKEGKGAAVSKEKAAPTNTSKHEGESVEDLAKKQARKDFKNKSIMTAATMKDKSLGDKFIAAYQKEIAHLKGLQ